jgi:NitT/TauT family transport system ATP-binding protein
MRVRVDSISKVYPAPRGGRLVALDDVSLEIGDGELVTLLGPSGCGKSTLLQVVAGLEPPTSGRITFEGAPPGEVLTAVVFQEHALFPWRTVRDNVTFGLEVRGVPLAERAASAHELLALVGLEGLADRYPHHLSGGMRQRVAIARALAVEPALLLMDEPFSALDALTRRRMQDDFQALRTALGLTVVLVTHDVPEALRLADGIAVLDRGRVAQQGTAAEIRDHPADGFVRDLLAAARP